jgi:hypothetical protein
MDRCEKCGTAVEENELICNGGLCEGCHQDHLESNDEEE